jgi:hypothetical protein
MGMRGVVAVVLLAGCAGSFERLPGQDDAERIVWRELYGEEGDPPPVEWLDKDAPVGGYAFPGWKVQVMRNDSTTRTNGGPCVTRYFSETAYAHELMHAHTFNRTGDIDAAHWRGDWELADVTAKRALRDAGL